NKLIRWLNRTLFYVNGGHYPPGEMVKMKAKNSQCDYLTKRAPCILTNGTSATVPGIVWKIPALAVLIIPNPHMPILAHKFVIFNLKSRIRPAALWSRQERACFPAHNTATADSERANRFNILCVVLVLFPTSDSIGRLLAGRLTCRLRRCRRFLLACLSVGKVFQFLVADEAV